MHSPLHGIPLLVKDNIGTADLNTTGERFNFELKICELMDLPSWINSPCGCKAGSRLDSNFQASQGGRHHPWKSKSFPMGQLSILVSVVFAWVELDRRADLWGLLSKPKSRWFIWG